MSRHTLPLVVLSLVGVSALGVSTLGVAYAGSRVVRSHGFQHLRAMHGDRADHQAQARAMFEEALGEIDASDAQAAEIMAITDSAHGQLEAMHEGLEAHHDQLEAVFTAPTVDREALEELRLEGLAGVEQASLILVGAIGDVAEVLSAEQRADLVVLAEELHGE